jgi:hypothetical protein
MQAVFSSTLGTFIVVQRACAQVLEFRLLVEMPTILTKWPSLIGPFLPS